MNNVYLNTILTSPDAALKRCASACSMRIAGVHAAGFHYWNPPVMGGGVAPRT